MLTAERKSINTTTDMMDADIEGRKLTGYFATWDIDRVRDVIVQGAFKKTFDERGPRIKRDGKYRSKIKVALNHDQVIGLPVRFWEDQKGAGYEALIDPTPIGDLVIARVKSGSLDSNSFQYDVLDSEYDREEKIRYLKELRVYEAGPVDYPCNEAAEIEELKNLKRFKSFLEDKNIEAQVLEIFDDMKSGKPLSAAALAILDVAFSFVRYGAKAGSLAIAPDPIVEDEPPVTEPEPVVEPVAPTPEPTPEPVEEKAAEIETEQAPEEEKQVDPPAPEPKPEPEQTLRSELKGLKDTIRELRNLRENFRKD